MTVQWPPPGHARSKVSRRDPFAALEAIERDKIEATCAIKLLLDGLAKKHNISPDAIDSALGAGYVADLLDDVFLEIEEELGRECDEPPTPS